MKEYLLVVLFLGNILLGQSTGVEKLVSIQKDYDIVDLNKYQKSQIRMETDSTKENYRQFYFHFSIGVSYLFSIGLGYQINEDWAIGLKGGNYWLSGGTFGPNSGSGYGIKISKRTHLNYISNINLELLPFLKSGTDRSKKFFKGIAVDMNIGNEKIISPGIYFSWAVGLTASCARHTPPLYLPNLKIGFNINF